MLSIPKEVVFSHFIFNILGLAAVFAIFIFGFINLKIKYFKEKMLTNWKQALVISAFCYIGRFLGSLDFSYLTNIWGLISIFCQCLIGLTIARSISAFEPLSVTKSIIQGEQKKQTILTMFLFSILTFLVIIFVGSFSTSICQQVFGEVVNSSQTIKMLPQNKFLSFFTLLSGAGIAEETLFRLIFLSLFLKLTNNTGIAIILSSLLFGIYHFTPLNSMYLAYWHYPISQFVGVCLVGCILGVVYLKRGYETAVLSHTFVDWLQILIFMK